VTYRWMRWFHSPASALMVATPDIHRRLAARGFTNLAMWSRGVFDVQLDRSAGTIRSRGTGCGAPRTGQSGAPANFFAGHSLDLVEPHFQTGLARTAFACSS